MSYVRGDGVVIDDVDLEEIEKRIERAEYAAAHLSANNNASMWFRYYDDTTSSNVLVNDFKRLLRENKDLKKKLSDALYKIESLGGE